MYKTKLPIKSSFRSDIFIFGSDNIDSNISYLVFTNVTCALYHYGLY